MIPSAKIEALEKAPPENMLSKDIKPSLVWFSKGLSPSGFTPGRTINDPKRYTRIKRNVKRILFLKSSIFQMFFIV
jgi:hypothetical protein